MSEPKAVARLDNDGFLWLWCDPCDTHHRVTVRGDGHPKWEWNGDLVAVTLSPSIRVRYDFGLERAERTCHSFVKDGQWQYLSDCTHALAGQTVQLPELP